MEIKREQITIFCDGSCYANHPEKLGGYGVYIQTEKEEYWISKGFKKTTISRMELRAILAAIQSVNIDTRSTVNIYSDSKYSVDMIKEKGFQWKQDRLKGFANEDLLDLIFTEIERHKKTRIKLHWVPGHRVRLDDPIVMGNCIADLLAHYKNHKTHIKDTLEKNSYLYSRERKYDPSKDPNFLEYQDSMIGDIY